MRYNVKNPATGVVCCSGNDATKLCPRCRATVASCTCDECRRDPLAARALRTTAAFHATVTGVPPPPSQIDAIRAARGLSAVTPTPPVPPIALRRAALATGGVPPPPDLAEALREAGR